MHQKSDFDIIIIGGGVAGLWVLNRLRQQGYRVALFEIGTLGGRQTVLSQGIIHGGIKYTLKGQLTPSAQSISAMPAVWQACLQGTGELDLSSTQVLSHYHYLWSTKTLASKMSAFLASKVISSDTLQLKPEHYPPAFKDPGFRGQVYQVAETVLHVPSLIESLTKPVWDCLFKIKSIEVKSKDNCITHLEIQDALGNVKQVRANRYIFAAGEGNEALLTGLSKAPLMQRRPLHMVYVTTPYLTPLYAHCIKHQTTPRITITSHPMNNGQWCWYLGGQLAEEGVNKSPKEQYQVACEELSSLFPWLDWSKANWGSVPIHRAEARQANGQKPEASSVFAQENYIVAWPTKLAFAPQLSQTILSMLQGITADAAHSDILENWEKPALSLPAWEK